MSLLNEVIIPIIKPIFALLTAGFGVFLLAMWNELKHENKKLNEEAKDVKTARKIESNNRNLTRKQLVDEL